VRVGTVITFLHSRRNLVVWLGDAMTRIHSPGVIAKSAKRHNVGHREEEQALYKIGIYALVRFRMGSEVAKHLLHKLSAGSAVHRA
jgi:hypothetical protein